MACPGPLGLMSWMAGIHVRPGPEYSPSPQLLLFTGLFGVGLYFMCHISVGLDQELALPKVSLLGGLTPLGFRRVRDRAGGRGLAGGAESAWVGRLPAPPGARTLQRVLLCTAPSTQHGVLQGQPRGSGSRAPSSSKLGIFTRTHTHHILFIHHVSAMTRVPSMFEQVGLSLL